MSEAQERKLDWVHLGQGVEPQSLWTCLHDAYLRRIHSDLLQQSVILEFESPHLQKRLGVADNVRFRFLLTGVSSVRAVTCVRWPGPSPDLTGKPIVEQNLLVEAYQSRWREESVSWSDFEHTFTTTDAYLDIHDAELVQDENTATLRLSGMLDGDEWHGLFLRAARLLVSRSDDEPFSLDELIALGEGYWEAFSERSAQRQQEISGPDADE